MTPALIDSNPSQRTHLSMSESLVLILKSARQLRLQVQLEYLLDASNYSVASVIKVSLEIHYFRLIKWDATKPVKHSRIHNITEEVGIIIVDRIISIAFHPL